MNGRSLQWSPVVNVEQRVLLCIIAQHCTSVPQITLALKSQEIAPSSQTEGVETNCSIYLRNISVNPGEL